MNLYDLIEQLILETGDGFPAGCYIPGELADYAVQFELQPWADPQLCETDGLIVDEIEPVSSGVIVKLTERI